MLKIYNTIIKITAFFRNHSWAIIAIGIAILSLAIKINSASLNLDNIVYTNYNNYSSELSSEELVLQEKIIEDIWNYMINKNYRIKISCIKDKTDVTIFYPNLQKIYTRRNKDVENQIILIYRQIKDVYISHNLPEEEITIYVEDSDNNELIYFCVKDNAVNWTCYDKQLMWNESNDAKR